LRRLTLAVTEPAASVSQALASWLIRYVKASRLNETH
jgi:hypothetical protein